MPAWFKPEWLDLEEAPANTWWRQQVDPPSPFPFPPASDARSPDPARSARHLAHAPAAKSACAGRCLSCACLCAKPGGRSFVGDGAPASLAVQQPLQHTRTQERCPRVDCRGSACTKWTIAGLEMAATAAAAPEVRQTACATAPDPFGGCAQLRRLERGGLCATLTPPHRTRHRLTPTPCRTAGGSGRGRGWWREDDPYWPMRDWGDHPMRWWTLAWAALLAGKPPPRNASPTWALNAAQQLAFLPPAPPAMTACASPLRCPRPAGSSAALLTVGPLSPRRALCSRRHGCAGHARQRGVGFLRPGSSRRPGRQRAGNVRHEIHVVWRGWRQGCLGWVALAGSLGRAVWRVRGNAAAGTALQLPQPRLPAWTHVARWGPQVAASVLAWTQAGPVLRQGARASCACSLPAPLPAHQVPWR